MQTTWITRGENPRLRIIALGWAADPSMVGPREGFDTVCLYDYRTIEPQWWEGYSEVHLTAWSYGVWAAEQIFSRHATQFATATAINGTPRPTDSQYGIEPRIFELTVRGIEKAGTQLFVERMCHGMAQPVTLGRPESECVEELRSLATQFREPYQPLIQWTEAIVGGEDRIFPPDSQKAYWHDIPTQIIATMPHYPIGIL